MVDVNMEQTSDGQNDTPSGAPESSRPSTNNSTMEEIMSKPIYSPPPVGPDFVWERDEKQPMSLMLRIGRFYTYLIREPALWIRKNIVEPNRGEKYYWYHRKYPRALPIDECYTDDLPCIFEANNEYHRTRKIDRATVDLLRWRRDNCLYWKQINQGVSHVSEDCRPLQDIYLDYSVVYHMKYGDLRKGQGVIHAYNKQKHRMIVERRLAEQAKLAGGQKE